MSAPSLPAPVSRPKARVFLSSGQKDGSSEVDLTFQVKKYLEDECHFLVTVGTGANAPIGVAEKVLQRLREADYFILVDFARDTVRPEDSPEEEIRRGSLFSEQELAIAIFRGLDFLPFIEEGIPTREGILKHVQSAPVAFTKATLLEVVRKTVGGLLSAGTWDNEWRNELALSRVGRRSDSVGWAPYGDEGKFHSKYFHVEVENHHKDQIATGVHAYLEGWHEVGTAGPPNQPPLVELKFSGVRTRSVSIPPRKSREFDGVFVFFEAPGHAWVGLNTFLRDWLGLDELYHFQGVGKELDLDFVVFSTEFAPARIRLRLKIGVDGDHTELFDASSPSPPPTPPAPPASGSSPFDVHGSGAVLSTIDFGTITGKITVDSPNVLPSD
ncbi:MAG TPA: hypothetical protein VMH38_00545 [Thermoplasmata archaeon]|nr:hypothetical protein [Thermoplasmata archaeon]